MVLAAAVRDLEGTEAVAELGAALERRAALQPVEQGAAYRVAAAGGVDDGARLQPGHMGLAALLPHVAALRAERDDDAAQGGVRQRLERRVHALAQHRRFIVVERDPARLRGK